MIPYPGMKNITAKDRNGVHPAMEKPSRKTQTANDLSLVVILLLWSKQTEMIWFTRTAKPRPKRSNCSANINPWISRFGWGSDLSDRMSPLLHPENTTNHSSRTPKWFCLKNYPATGMIFHRLASIIAPAKTCRWIFVNKRRRLADTMLPSLTSMLRLAK